MLLKPLALNKHHLEELSFVSHCSFLLWCVCTVFPFPLMNTSQVYEKFIFLLLFLFHSLNIFVEEHEEEREYCFNIIDHNTANH